MKYLFLAFLIFLFYRMVFKPKSLDRGPKNPPIQEKDSDDFVDYEEVD